MHTFAVSTFLAFLNSCSFVSALVLVSQCLASVFHNIFGRLDYIILYYIIILLLLLSPNLPVVGDRALVLAIEV